MWRYNKMAHEDHSGERNLGFGKYSRMRTVQFQFEKSLIKYVYVPQKFYVSGFLKTII